MLFNLIYLTSLLLTFPVGGNVSAQATSITFPLAFQISLFI